MGLWTKNLTFDLLTILVALLAIIVTYLKWTYGYWKRKGLEYIEPSIPFGNMADLIAVKKAPGEFWRSIYEKLKNRKVRHGGFFMLAKPHYMPVDLEIVKHIMQNDFSHFVNHGLYINEKDDPLTGHLFQLEDAKWRNLRIKLTPTFTSGKMKMMFPTLVSCTKGLKEILDENASKHEVTDVKTILQRFTMDIIGSCAFGVECNCMKDPNSEFLSKGKLVLDTNWKNVLKFLMTLAIPREILIFFKFTIVDPSITKFFIDLVSGIVKHREENNIYRKDFMHLLLQLKNRGKVTDDEKLFDDDGKNTELNLSMNELAAQVFVFFVAGFETSSTTMTFAIYELATNPEIQEKARKEVLEVLEKHGDLTYEAVMDMKYMDRVLQETLRKYPPVPSLQRMCNKDYLVPGTDILIEKGTLVDISSLGIQHDPEYYPDPEKFDPDRFTEENKAKRPHYAWLPFGEGPRICIGMRFGMMQSKTGLATILKNYKIVLNNKTKLPLEFDKRSFILATEGALWVNFEKI